MIATKIGLQEESINISNVLYFHYKTIPFRFFKTGDMAYYAMCVELAGIEMEKNTYAMMEKERWEGSSEFRYTVEERGALTEHKKECNQMIKDLKVRKKVCVDRVHEFKLQISAIKSLL